MLVGVQRQLLEAGIPFESIPQDWLNYIVAATRKWMATTQEGSQDAADLLGLQTFRGETNKNYMIVDHEEVVENRVDGDNVWFVQGLIFDGAPADLARLRVSEKTREPCDGCGMIASCLKIIRDPDKDVLTSLCNFCCTYHESLQVKDLGGLDTCQRCTVTNCAHHPERHIGWG